MDSALNSKQSIEKFLEKSYKTVVDSVVRSLVTRYHI